MRSQLRVLVASNKELADLKAKAPASTWSMLANKVAPYVIEEGGTLGLKFLVEFAKAKTYTDDSVLPYLKNYDGEPSNFHFDGSLLIAIKEMILAMQVRWVCQSKPVL